MKKLIFISLLFFACGQNIPEHIQAAESAEDAIMYIEAYQGDIKEFRLELKEELMVRGRKAKRELAVGIIGKAILDSKGWYFDGYEENEDGTRLYKFKLQQ
ncbi:MAG: hypothetical protein DWQ02_11815 [Bacteroidetes bacterium]|nr:MAG: hypothetical protein DWQ02_11815 [Bacteroidota bacterium]